MRNFFYKFKAIYIQIYENAKNDGLSIGEDIDDFRRWPYTNLKARIYMALSALIVLMLQNSLISPNFITIMYALLALIPIPLILIDVSDYYIFAVLIFFLRGVLDWADGALARLREEVSVEGAVLDPWAGLFHSNLFYLFVGIYVYLGQEDNVFILYTAMVGMAFKATNIRMYALSRVGTYFLKNRNFFRASETFRKPNILNYNDIANDATPKGKVLSLLISILDDRSRSVDFIISLIVIEQLFSINFILIFVFILLTLRIFAEFMFSFYFVILKKGVSAWIDGN